MKPETLLAIKSDFKKLHKVAEALCEIFSQEEYKMISVALQNLSFDATNCYGYNQEQAIQEMRKIQKFIEQLYKYHGEDEFWIGYFVKEIDMIFTGHPMSESEQVGG